MIPAKNLENQRELDVYTGWAACEVGIVTGKDHGKALATVRLSKWTRPVSSY